MKNLQPLKTAPKDRMFLIYGYKYGHRHVTVCQWRTWTENDTYVESPAHPGLYIKIPGRERGEFRSDSVWLRFDEAEGWMDIP